MSEHIPVLLNEVMDWMNPQEGEQYVDGTIGCGGHASAFLKRILPSGFLIGIDRDRDALKMTEESLSVFKDHFQLCWGNYSQIKSLLSEKGEGFADGIFLDLGVSSMQLDREERGFSFRQEAQLDMRMDSNEELSAFYIVNHWSEKDLTRIFYEYGEERFSRSIAKRIVREREKKPIETTCELAQMVLRSYRKYSKIYPATRVFQALRIAVNEELMHLELFLKNSLFCLKSGGHLCIISYHSLEDRYVKHSFKQFVTEGLCEKLHSKPIIASDDEVKINRRSRSAKMRVCQKI